MEELLRFESPLQLNNRRATGPVELADRTLPAGTFITLGIGAANRDPAVFADPDRLDVARKPNNHLAFGQGRHACSGMNVARLEGRIAINALLARYPRISRRGEPARDLRVRFRGLRHTARAAGWLKCRGRALQEPDQRRGWCRPRPGTSRGTTAASMPSASAHGRCRGWMRWR